MVLRPGAEGMAAAIFEKWELDFAIIGRVTDTGRFVLKLGDETVGDIPVKPLVHDAPIYERPYEITPPAPDVKMLEGAGPIEPLDALKRLLATPDLCSKRWIWEQYDHMVMADTVRRPGGDAAVVRIHGSNRGLAISTDCTPRYCLADPEQGGAQAVAETWRNLTAVGARPLAITDCMNFASPERPRIMGQFVGCIKGMAAACEALDYPVVSGNVSFYNETEGQGILPTPAIGGIGLIDDLDKTVDLALAAEGDALVLIGATGGHLGASLFAREILGREDGPAPAVDLAVERRHGDFVRGLIADGEITACHDISDGGLLVAVAEMALAALDAGREIGVRLAAPESGVSPLAWLFGEDQGRYLVTLPANAAPALSRRADNLEIPMNVIGLCTGATLTLGGSDAISIAELRQAHETWLPDLMAGD